MLPQEVFIVTSLESCVELPLQHLSTERTTNWKLLNRDLVVY